MLVAVTQSDQTNLVACKIARSLFNVPTRIARLRSPRLPRRRALLSDENFAVDYAICPEQDITDYIVKLIEFPEALQVLEFADGLVTLVGVRAYRGRPAGRQADPRHARASAAGVDARIAAIFREHQPVDPDGDTVIEAGDEVFLLAASRAYPLRACSELRRMLEPVRARHDRRRRQHRRARRRDAGHEVRGQAHRSATGARAEIVASKLGRHAGAARRRDRREPAGAGEHRRDGHVPRPDQRRRGQHHGRLAGQAAWLQARAGADQPPRLCRHGAGRTDRHRHLARPRSRSAPC